MNINDINNQKGYQENWNHDKYMEVNKDDKNFNQGKNKSRKSYNRFGNETDNSNQIVNSKTLVADFIEQPKKQPVKKQTVYY